MNQINKGILCPRCRHLAQQQYHLTGSIHMDHYCTICKENIIKILHLEERP